MMDDNISLIYPISYLIRWDNDEITYFISLLTKYEIVYDISFLIKSYIIYNQSNITTI